MPTPRRTPESTFERTPMTPDPPSRAPRKVKPVTEQAPPRTGKTGRKRDWAAEDKKLEDRGRVDVIIQLVALEDVLRPKGRGARRGSPYPQALIDLINLLGTMSSLPYRQRLGMARTILPQFGLNVSLPDHVTLWRRGQEVSFTPYQVEEVRKGRLVVVIDGTGLALRAVSGWRRYKHGGTFHQKWVKVHLGIDHQSGAVVALEVTASDGPGSGDVSQGPALIEQAARQGIRTVLADSAYDARKCYRAAREHGAVLVTPPKQTAVYGLDPDRDQHLAQIGRVGERRWRDKTGYGRRAHVEEAIGVHKHIFGEHLRAQTLEGATGEIISRVNLYNLWRQLETNAAGVGA